MQLCAKKLLFCVSKFALYVFERGRVNDSKTVLNQKERLTKGLFHKELAI